MSNQITGDNLELLFEMLEEEELMDAMFDAETDDFLAEVIMIHNTHYYFSNKGVRDP